MQATKGSIEKTFAVNVFGPLFLMQAAVPVMPRGGRIINIGSIASKMGVSAIPIYSAAKAAMDMLMYASAMEVRTQLLTFVQTSLVLADNGGQ
jgi:NAD(P)-dependent dehydrogenase (short-subunit alcohol dehydrogenase family)